MQVVNRSIRRSAALLVVGGALLLVLAGAEAWLAWRSQAAFQQVVTERDTRRAASNLMTAMRDVEIGYRGFLLTGDASFLGPYDEARTKVPAMLADLDARAEASDQAAAESLKGVGDLVEERLALAQAAVERARAGTPDVAALQAGERQGKAVMDELRGRVDGFLTGTATSFEAIFASQQGLNRWTLTASLVAGLAMMVVVGAAFRVLARQLKLIRRADVELQRMNQGLEERVSARTKDLIRANQEVQRFAYIVTHDLRAPLVNIMGFTSELETALPPIQEALATDAPAPPLLAEARRAAAEDLPESLSFIRASTKKMDALIAAILKISRDGRRELRPERIDLAALAQGAVDAVAHQIAEQGGEASVDGGAVAIVSDRLSVEQALGNLVDNAVKYAQPGRPLRLAIRVRPDGPRAVRIEVEDNGRGIADQDRERVFDLFRRAGRQDRPGEGIGLAHVRSLVRNLGGDISLRSREGEGSVFAIELPADLRQVREAAAA